MNKQKGLGILMVVIGLVIALVSLFGYELGIAEMESFGAFQMGGTLVGILLLALGLLRLMDREKGRGGMA